MPRNRNELSLQDVIPFFFPHSSAEECLNSKDLARLARTNRFFNQHLQQANQLGRMKVLQQAVLEGNIPLIQKILMAHPTLLLQEPEKRNLIQNPLTKKKIIGEIPFAMALKTRQNTVIEAMLSYLKQIENGQERALQLWEEVENIPPEEPYDFDALMVIIAQEVFPNGAMGDLSFETEQAVDAFYNSFSPIDAIALNDDYDVLVQLLSMKNAFIKYFDRLDEPQRKLYHLVFRFLQSLLQHEDGMVFFKGVYETVQCTNSYRSSSDDEAIYHRKVEPDERPDLWLDCIKRHCTLKTVMYGELKERLTCGDLTEPEPQTIPGCVII